MISAFFPLLVASLLAWGGGTRIAGGEPPAVVAAQGDGGPRVVAGAGEVAPELVERVRALVDEEAPRLRKLFDDKPTRGFVVHVHADREALPEALAALHHPGSPGFALLGQHQIHLLLGEMRRSGASLRGVVVHELVHEMLDQYVAPHGRRMPRWFHEGLAQSIAGDTYLGASEEDLIWPLGAGRLPSFGELRGAFPSDPDRLRSAYGQSYSYVAWLMREYGLRNLLTAARAADEHTAFESALSGRLGLSSIDLEEGWHRHVLHGSGAPWRVLLDQCFSLLLIGALPVLVLALIRRLGSEQRAAQQLRLRESMQAPVVEPTASELADLDEADLDGVGRDAAESAAGDGTAGDAVPGDGEPDDPERR